MGAILLPILQVLYLVLLLLEVRDGNGVGLGSDGAQI